MLCISRDEYHVIYFRHKNFNKNNAISAHELKFSKVTFIQGKLIFFTFYKNTKKQIQPFLKLFHNYIVGVMTYVLPCTKGPCGFYVLLT